jgi:hypothetical protein
LFKFVNPENFDNSVKNRFLEVAFMVLELILVFLGGRPKLYSMFKNNNNDTKKE